MAIKPKFPEFQMKAPPFHRNRLTLGNPVVENSRVRPHGESRACGNLRRGAVRGRVCTRILGLRLLRRRERPSLRLLASEVGC